MKKSVIILATALLIIPLVAANSAPQINGNSKQVYASPGIDITYWMTYTDAEGTMPSYAKICFSELGCKEMTKISGDAKSGINYEYVFKNQQRGYEYYFEASDGQNTAREPNYESGTLSPVNLMEGIPENNKIMFFSKDSSKPLWVFDTGIDWVAKAAISANGEYAAAKTSDYVYVFSRDNNKPIITIKCIDHTGSNENAQGGVAMSADGLLVAAGCANRIELYSTSSKSSLWEYSEGISLYSLAMSNNGNYIAVGTSMKDRLFLFSKSSNQPAWQFSISEGDFHGLALSSTGEYIASGTHCPDRRAYLHSVQSNNPLVSYLTGEGSPVWSAAISSSGNIAAYGLDGLGNDQKSIFVFKSQNTEPFRAYKTEGWVRSLDISDNGKYLAAGSRDGLHLYDTEKDSELWIYETDRVGSVGISSNGEHVAAASKDKNVYFFSKNSSTPVWQYNAGTWVNSIALSSDGNYIIAGTGTSEYFSEGHEVTDASGQNVQQGVENAVCGDGICMPAFETTENCASDCKGGVTSYQNDTVAVDYKEIQCGDGVCEGNESAETCYEDCTEKRQDSTDKQSIFARLIDWLKNLFGK